MIKKLALAAVLAVGSTAAFADRDAGCGIGSQVWAGQSGKVAKVLAQNQEKVILNSVM